jgi:hypothetical protein
MNRKTVIVVCLAVVLAFGVALAAGAQAKKAEKAELGGQKLGIIFNVPNILMGVGDSSDAFLAGLGLKYWIGDKAALRALLEFSLDNPGAGTTTTVFGVGGAFEYHFIKGKVSPYTGANLGLQVTSVTGAATDLTLFLGGILGAEVRVLDYLGMFAEYNLRLTFNEPALNIDLALGNGGSLGVILYLP